MKNKKFFISLFVICLSIFALFNVLFFVIPISKQYSNASIWISYACSNASIIIFFITSLLELNKKEIKNSVFGYPIIKSSLVLSIICIIYSIFSFSYGSFYELRGWITILVEAILYCGFVVSITLAIFNKNHIQALDNKNKQKNSFKKELLNRINEISNEEHSDEIDGKLKELLDIVSYIDPVSIKETEDCEDQIIQEVNNLEFFVKNGDLQSEIKTINSIVNKIDDRKNTIISNRK